MAKEGSSDYKKVRRRWFFKEPLIEWFFVEPKIVLMASLWRTFWSTFILKSVWKKNTEIQKIFWEMAQRRNSYKFAKTQGFVKNDNIWKFLAGYVKFTFSFLNLKLVWIYKYVYIYIYIYIYIYLYSNVKHTIWRNKSHLLVRRCLETHYYDCTGSLAGPTHLRIKITFIRHSC